jgi:hypothetical protein
VAAGCGGDDEVTADEFQDRVAEAQENVQTEVEGLRDADSSEALRDEADEAADAIRSEADELEDLDVPEDVEQAQDAVVDGFRRLADGLEERAAGLGDGDVQQFLDEIEGLTREDVEGVLDQLRESGIDIPTTDSP